MAIYYDKKWQKMDESPYEKMRYKCPEASVGMLQVTQPGLHNDFPPVPKKTKRRTALSSIIFQYRPQPSLYLFYIHIFSCGTIGYLVFFYFADGKYLLSGWAKYQPHTEEAGYIARFSVR